MAKAQNKTVPTDKSIDLYLAGLEENRREEAKRLIPLFQEIIGYPPVLWGDSIVGFGQFLVVSPSGREVDWCLAGFAMRKAAISFYLSFDISKMGAYLERLGKHSHGKGCLYVKKLSDVDVNVLKEMITISVKEMLKWSEENGSMKKRTTSSAKV